MQGLTYVDQAILKLNSLTLACLYLVSAGIINWFLIIAGIETSPGHFQIYTESSSEFQRGGRENRIQVLFPLWGVELRALLMK